MSKVKLTAGRVRDFRCDLGKQQAFLWDTDAPGLGIRVTANNAKAYIFQGKLGSNTVRITIGDVKTWDIETGNYDRPGAREEARRLQTLIDKGIDPRHAKAEESAKIETRRQESERKDLTISELWPIYTDARKHKWSARHLADHLAIADGGGRPVKRGKAGQKKEPGVMSALMPLRLSDLNKEKIKAWLRDETARRPTQAALAFRLLRAFLNWCNDTPEYAGLAAPDTCSSRMARENIPKQKPKRDCLQREQLPAWFDAVREIKNPVISAYLQILLLTGPRREELAELKWDDIDFKWNSITLHDKVEGERVIPLTPYVKFLLTELKRLNALEPKVSRRRRQKPQPPWSPSLWVFSSRTAASGRLQEPSIQHRQACAEAGVDGMTLHGLRRSFKTLTGWIECPAGVVAQIQGHKPSATAEKHYEVRPLDMLRMWHTKIEAWFLTQANVTFDYPKTTAAGDRASHH